MFSCPMIGTLFEKAEEVSWWMLDHFGQTMSCHLDTFKLFWPLPKAPGLEKVHKYPKLKIIERRDQRFKLSKRYLKVQGVQKVPKGPRCTKGTSLLTRGLLNENHIFFCDFWMSIALSPLLVLRKLKKMFLTVYRNNMKLYKIWEIQSY